MMMSEPKYKIAVLADNAANNKIIKSAVSALSYKTQIYFFSDEKEALTFAHKELPIIIFVIATASFINDIKVLKSLKTEANTKNILVIYFADQPNDKNQKEIVEAGADIFFEIPVNKFELLTRLKILFRLSILENRQLNISENELVSDESKDKDLIKNGPSPSQSRNEKSEKIIQEKSEKLRLIIEHSPLGVSTTDLDGNFVDVNPAFCNMLGYEKEEMIGKHFNAFSHPDDAKRNESLFSDLLQEKFPFFDADNRYLCKSGKIVHVHIRAQLIKDGKGNPLFQTALIENVTERIRNDLVQKALYRISNAAITAYSVESLIGFIREEIGKIIDTNNFYVALYDQETDSLNLPYFADDKDEMEYIPPGKSLTRYVLETKNSLLVNSKIEEDLTSKGLIENMGSESKIWLGVPLKIDESVIGVVAVQSYTDENAYDLTDLKILEFVSEQISLSIIRKKTFDELQSALRKATEADRLKSAFLATMSHELRTPLNAIIGFSEFLNKELDSDSVEKFGEIIYKSGNHLLSIVNDLFDITIIESGETKLRKEEIVLNTILLDINDLFVAKQYRDGKEDLELKLIIPSDIENFVFRTDENKLKQILTNLLKNALKFTSKGFIHFGCNLVKDETQNFLKFYVKDSGIGIASDKHHEIFEMFTQVEDSNTRKYGGTGIGLSVAKRLVELLGGNIWVESELGHGSTFYFTIPVMESIMRPSEEFNEFTFIGVDKQVLVVEDNEASSQYIDAVLRKYGLNCIHASNGKEAISIFEEYENIGLILMDLNMPVMNGLEATKKIKAKNKDIPVIAQTAYAVAGDKENALAGGCDDYIAKPINMKELLSKMKIYLLHS